MAQVATYRDTLKLYKFYLSFENTLCKSYITEKFLYTFASKDGPIPIALGGLSTADYERQALHMIMVALTIKNVVYVKGSINRYLSTAGLHIGWIKTFVKYWSSGFGRRVMFQRSRVRIPVPYTRWTLITFICCKNCNFCLKDNNKRKRGRGWPIFLKVQIQSRFSSIVEFRLVVVETIGTKEILPFSK